MRQTFVLSRLNFPAAFSTMPEPEGPRVVAPEDRPFLHHGQRPRFRGYKKFKSPQKRASKLLFELEKEAVSQAMESKPEVWKTDFRVGDAVEVDLLPRGGAKSTNTQKARGVILGVFKKRMDYSILIRDVLEGAPVERRIPLHSPLVKAVRVLYRNYIYKGSKKVRRSKLYYLRDLPLGSKYESWHCLMESQWTRGYSHRDWSPLAHSLSGNWKGYRKERVEIIRRAKEDGQEEKDGKAQEKEEKQESVGGGTYPSVHSNLRQSNLMFELSFIVVARCMEAILFRQFLP